MVHGACLAMQDSAKTRMQSQKTDGGKLKYTSTIQTLTSVARTEGVPSLWKGFMPYFARSGTHTVSLLTGTSERGVDRAAIPAQGGAKVTV